MGSTSKRVGSLFISTFLSGALLSVPLFSFESFVQIISTHPLVLFRPLSSSQPLSRRADSGVEIKARPKSPRRKRIRSLTIFPFSPVSSQKNNNVRKTSPHSKRSGEKAQNTFFPATSAEKNGTSR